MFLKEIQVIKKWKDIRSLFLERLILGRFQYDRNSSTHSLQLLPKSQWYFVIEIEKTQSKIHHESQGILSGQNNLVKEE
jgi:hypothetical protein